jgi:DNA-binding Xre family transcriptional regulator
MNSLFPNLVAAMEQRGVSNKNLAEAIGLSEDVVSFKMQGVVDWTLVEALTICQFLRFTDLKLLFLR